MKKRIFMLLIASLMIFSAFGFSAFPVMATDHIVVSTIQQAINFASPGDTITVLPGDYTNEGVITIDKSITIMAKNNAAELLPDYTVSAKSPGDSTNSIVKAFYIPGQVGGVVIQGFEIHSGDMGPINGNISTGIYSGGGNLCEGKLLHIQNNLFVGSGNFANNERAIEAGDGYTLKIRMNMFTGYQDGIWINNFNSSAVVTTVNFNTFDNISRGVMVSKAFGLVSDNNTFMNIKAKDSDPLNAGRAYGLYNDPSNYTLNIREMKDNNFLLSTFGENSYIFARTNPVLVNGGTPLVTFVTDNKFDGQEYNSTMSKKMTDAYSKALLILPVPMLSVKSDNGVVSVEAVNSSIVNYGNVNIILGVYDDDDVLVHQEIEEEVPFNSQNSFNCDFLVPDYVGYTYRVFLWGSQNNPLCNFVEGTVNGISMDCCSDCADCSCDSTGCDTMECNCQDMDCNC